jgi:hypothetical protein
MAVTIVKYDNFLLGQMKGITNAVVDFDTDIIKIALVTSTYAPLPATHDFFDDITNQVTGTNYVAGGLQLGSPTISISSGGVVIFDAADCVWSQSASGFANARYGIIYKATGTAATSRLICYINFGADQGNTVSDFVIVWDAAGIINWS